MCPLFCIYYDMYSGYVRSIIIVYFIILTIPVCNFQDTRIPKYRGNKFLTHKKIFKPNFRNAHRNLYTNSNNNKFDTSKSQNSEQTENQPVIVKHFHFPSKISLQHRRLVKPRDNYFTMKQIHKMRKRREDDDKDKEKEDEEADKNDNESTKHQADNTELLEEIIENLDEIKGNTATTDIDKKCNLEGFWISDAASKTFWIEYKKVNITVKIQDPCADSLDTNIVTLKPPVKTENKTSNITVKFINFPTVPLKTQNEQLVFNKSWQFKVDVPFKGVGVLVLQAKYPPGKLVAVFVGQCHLCESHEAIFGQWIVSYLSTDCHRLPVCQTVHGDVLRRNQTAVNLRKGDT